MSIVPLNSIKLKFFFQDALNRQPSLNLTPGGRPSLSAGREYIFLKYININLAQSQCCYLNNVRKAKPINRLCGQWAKPQYRLFFPRGFQSLCTWDEFYILN